MAKNPVASMLAQAVAPGVVQAPPGKIGAKPKAVAPPKGVQKTAPGGPLPGKAPPPPLKPGKGFGGRPAPKSFGKGAT
jgi:hypothetical protein